MVVLWGFLGFLFGNHEISQSIGSVGVGLLPFITIGFAIYFFKCRAKYHQMILQENEAERPLLELGLSYWPLGRHNKSRRLYVVKTKEELNVNDFLTLKVTKEYV